MRELEYLVGYLVRREWVENAVGFMSTVLEYQLSVEGHARLAELDQTAAESSKAFVAMWFDDSMDEVWENAIKPGIEDAGYEAIRIDRKEHVNKIDDEIIAELRRARFVVADFTRVRLFFVEHFPPCSWAFALAGAPSWVRRTGGQHSPPV